MNTKHRTQHTPRLGAEGSTAAGVDPKIIVECVRRLGEAVGAVGLAGGQVMDLECEAKQGVTLQELTHGSGAGLTSAGVGG